MRGTLAKAIRHNLEGYHPKKGERSGKSAGRRIRLLISRGLMPTSMKTDLVRKALVDRRSRAQSACKMVAV